MTGINYLDWAILSVSLFNAIISMWLGLTVLLNAERRVWGVILTGGGLMAAAAFFTSHTAILAEGLYASGEGIDFWWHIGWIPVIAAPYAWYAVMLWYAGYWNAPATQLRRRHRLWFALMSLLAVSLFGLALIFTPSFVQAITLDFQNTLTLGGYPPLLLIYPVFIVLCIALSIDALGRPERPARMLGDLARQRSRPWLLLASVALLAVSLLVSAAIAYGLRSLYLGYYIFLFPGFNKAVGLFDLSAAALIAIAIILLGQAIVSYEVFTGKTLPRRGFFRYWRGAIYLAGGYAVLTSFSIVAQLTPIYGLLLTAVLMISFYALWIQRSFAEREQYVRGLRPFVSSQRLLQQFVDTGTGAVSGARQIWQALCQDVLGASRARLIPLGPLAPLAGPPLNFPFGPLEPDIIIPPDAFTTPGDGFLALDPARYSPYRWAIPLWTERGLIGALLVDDKQDGGLYTQEEIDVARASGERILDMLAGEEMARRLMELQRRRLTESAVMDRRARRMLHDEVLPGLHTALLEISALPREQPAVQDAINTLTRAHRQIADLIHQVAAATPALGSADNLADAIHALLAGEFKDEFDTANLEVCGEPHPVDSLVEEVMFYAAREAIRNAALHGRPSGGGHSLHLDVRVDFGDGLTIDVADDGVGLDAEDLTPVDQPAPGARGGLALHSTMMAVIGGTLTAAQRPEGGVRITLRLPGETL